MHTVQDYLPPSPTPISSICFIKKEKDEWLRLWPPSTHQSPLTAKHEWELYAKKGLGQNPFPGSNPSRYDGVIPYWVVACQNKNYSQGRKKKMQVLEFFYCLTEVLNRIISVLLLRMLVTIGR
jgi:hypothetical protein